MLNWILGLGMYPIVFILYFVLKNTAKPQKGLVFGVTVKKEWLSDEEITAITDEYNKKMKRNTLIMAVLPVSCFLTDHVSIQMTIWTLWIFAVIVALELPFVQANKKVTRLRKEKGWQEESRGNDYVELKAAGEVRKVKFLPFLWPTLLSALAVLLPYLMIWFYGYRISDPDRIKIFVPVLVILAVCTLFFYPVAVWLDRRKTDVISTDSNVNINYARAKKNVWKNFWLQVAWCNAVYTFVTAIALVFDFSFVKVILWGVLVYSVVLIYLCFVALKKLDHVEKIYEKKKDISVMTQNDEGWIWGIMYYNPKDRHSMVENRIGMGTTINMATPFGKAMIAICILALLSVPVLCGWVILEEFVPIRLQVIEEQLQAKQLNMDYDIEIDTIENLELIEELPSWTKRNGSAMDNLEKGKFYVHNVGPCEVFLNPQNAVFLRFTAEDVVYYMSGVDDEETMEVYELLQDEANQ